MVIAQLASDGLKQWDGDATESDSHGVNLSSGYCDISVPVYATVKGVRKISYYEM